MRYFGMILVLFGIIIIAFPALLVILIGGFFIFLGVNMFLLSGGLSNPFQKSESKKGNDYVKFGKYKIYR